MPGARSINSSGSGSGGVKYFNPGVQTSDFEVTTPGSIFIRVDSTSGPALITPFASPQEGDRLKVLDYGGDAGDNPITILGLDVIGSNFGMREWEHDGSQYVLISSYKNIFYRDPVTDEILTTEQDTIVTNKIRAGSDPSSYAEMTKDGLEVFFQNVLALVATQNGLIAPNGAIGSQSPVDTTHYDDFQNIGAAIDANGVSYGNNLVTVDSNLCATLTATATYAINNTGVIGNAQAKTNMEDPASSPSIGHEFSSSIEIDLGAEYIIGGVNIRRANSVTTVTISVSNTSLTGPWIQVHQAVWGPVETREDAFFVTSGYRYVQVHNSQTGANMIVNLIQKQFAATTNTIETKAQPPKTITPSNCVFLDENDTPITSPNKLNVEWTEDGGATWSPQEDVFDFLARASNIEPAGMFWLRTQFIEGQRLKAVDVVGPSAQWVTNGIRSAYLVDGIEAVRLFMSGVHGMIQVHNMPTTDPQVAGQFWNDNGTVKVSAG